MDKINIISTPPWRPGEIRALLLRHLLATCGAVVVTCLGLYLTRSLTRCSEDSNGAHESQAVDDSNRCQAEHEELTRAHRWLAESKDSRGRPIETLRILERAMPADVWLREIVVSNNLIELVGLSRCEASIGKLMGSLRAGNAVSAPHLESSQVSADTSRELREFRMSGVLAARVHEREVGSEKGL